MDKINHPEHYTMGEIECLDAIQSALSSEEFEGYLKGNIFKYIWREMHKDGTKDLLKAKDYLEKIISVRGE